MALCSGDEGTANALADPPHTGVSRTMADQDIDLVDSPLTRTVTRSIWLVGRFLPM